MPHIFQIGNATTVFTSKYCIYSNILLVAFHNWICSWQTIFHRFQNCCWLLAWGELIFAEQANLLQHARNRFELFKNGLHHDLWFLRKTSSSTRCRTNGQIKRIDSKLWRNYHTVGQSCVKHDNIGCLKQRIWLFCLLNNFNRNQKT